MKNHSRSDPLCYSIQKYPHLLGLFAAEKTLNPAVVDSFYNNSSE